MPPRPTDAVVWEPSARWVRGVCGATTVVDSRSPVLIWEPDLPVPLYAFPESEVRSDLLRPAAEPDGGHPGESVRYDLVVDGETIPNAAWQLSGDLADYIAFEWFQRVGRGVDHWYEEDEEIFVHPRDPHKRVDALRSSRNVVVMVRDPESGERVALADSHAPVLLFETSLPTRFYLPVADVNWDVLEATELTTDCPYKGTARYWSIRAGAAASTSVPPNIAWSYPDPLGSVAVIRDLVCFYNEAVDIFVDGIQQVRPQTPFSAGLEVSKKGQ
jgi:uncharacterized protein (DUF427 family)